MPGGLTAFGISGLFLGGCGWNPGCLAICSHVELFATIVPREVWRYGIQGNDVVS